MNAIELLKSQHRVVESLFEEIEKDGADKKSLFAKIGDNLAAHASIEEALFYPAAFADETEDMLREAVEEHLSVKRILTDLLAVGTEDETFEAKVKVLKEQIEHHVGEEEDELFVKVKKILSKEDLEALGTDMKQLFDAFMAQQPRFDVPQETAEPAPLQ